MKIIGIILFFSFSTAFAQTKDYSADVQSIDSTIQSLYEVISGEAQAPRDWDRFKNLFATDAKLIPTGKNQEGKFVYRTMTPDDYIKMFTTRVTTGFFERELSNKIETYGTITHVFSTYETKEKKDGAVTNRGINSIQLFYDGTRYYILNIFWCAESLGFPLPDQYLNH